MINVNDLTHDYGSGRGIFDVSFEVKAGETLGFLGPNGAGKSTTMRHLMGFSRPQKGSAAIAGMDCYKESSSIMQKVGYLPGEVALPEGLSGEQFIKMMQDMRGVRNKQRTKELIDRFDLDPGGNVKRMSIGEKRKLAIVAAFMSDPEILLLDEPTSGLDPLMQEEFIKFIREEKQRGRTILLSSHIFSEVEALCDRIAIIKDGCLVSTVSAEEVRHGLHNIMTLELSDPDDMELVRKSGFEMSSSAGKELSCSVIVDDKDINRFVRLINRLKVKRFSEHSVTLEEYFMHFYKNKKSFGGVMYG